MAETDDDSVGSNTGAQYHIEGLISGSDGDLDSSSVTVTVLDASGTQVKTPGRGANGTASVESDDSSTFGNELTVL